MGDTSEARSITLKLLTLKLLTLKLLRQAREIDREVEAKVLGTQAGRAAAAAAAAHKRKVYNSKGLDRWSIMSEAAKALGAVDLIQRLAESSSIRWRVVVLNRRLCFRHCKGRDDDDRFQVAQLGLYEAAKRFDVDRGIWFSTYANWWVRALLQREIDRKDGKDLSTDGFSKLMSIRKLDRIEGMTDTKIADRLGISIERVRLLRVADLRAVSMDSTAIEGGMTLAERLSSPEPEETYSETVVARLELPLSQLKPRSRQVIELRFGLNDQEPMTYSQIGKVLRVTGECVRQILAKAVGDLNYLLTGDAMVGDRYKNRRQEAGLTQGQLSRLTAPLLKRSDSSVRSSVSQLEKTGAGSPEFKQAIDNVLDQALIDRKNREAFAVSALEEVQSFENLGGLDEAVWSPPPSGVKQEPMKIEEIRSALDKGETVKQENEDGSTYYARRVSPKAWSPSSGPLSVSTNGRYVDTPPPARSHDSVARMNAFLTRCGAPQAPLGEDIGWRLGWFEARAKDQNNKGG